MSLLRGWRTPSGSLSRDHRCFSERDARAEAELAYKPVWGRLCRVSCDPECHKPSSQPLLSQGHPFPPPSPPGSAYGQCPCPSPLASGFLLASPASRVNPVDVYTFETAPVSGLLPWASLGFQWFKETREVLGAWDGCRGAGRGKELEVTGPKGALVLESPREGGPGWWASPELALQESRRARTTRAPCSCQAPPGEGGSLTRLRFPSWSWGGPWSGATKIIDLGH